MKQYTQPQVTTLAETVFGVRSGKGSSTCHTSCTAGSLK